MSTALYRRYRPDTFADVIGQEHVTEPLMAAIDSGRINHAYLFSGPRGCGKTTSARIFARCLNCAQGPTSTPCGECDSCVDLARGGHGSLDVVEMDAASHGGVDDARDLRERAIFAPARDRYKIFIIDEAHMVTTQGFNALLKLVEEPPEHVKFVFATTEPEKVIGTIRSRTHHYPFRLVPPDRLNTYLGELAEVENIRLEDGVIPLVVRAGAGSVRDSLSVLDQLMAGALDGLVSYQRAVALLGYTPEGLLDDAIGALSAQDGAGLFGVVEQVISSGHDPRRFAEDLLERFRDLIVVLAAGENARAVLPEVPADQLERMRTQAGHLGAATCSRAADLVHEALDQMVGATSPRLQLELLCARLLLPAAEEGVRALAVRIDRIESMGGAAPRPSAEGGSEPAPSPAPVTAPPAPAPHAPREEPPAPPGPQTPNVGPASTWQTAAQAHEERSGPAQPAQVRPPQVEARSGSEGDGGWPSVNVPGQARPARPEASQQAPEPGQAAETGEPPAPGTAQAQRPAGPAHQEKPTPAPQGAPETAGLTVQQLRNRWPEVLQTLARVKRSTWALVAQDAQVVDLQPGVLTIGFSTAGLASAFQAGSHAESLARALADTLEMNLRIETTIVGASGRGGSSAPSGPPGPASAQPGRAAPPTVPPTAPASAGESNPAQESPDQAGWPTTAPVPAQRPRRPNEPSGQHPREAGGSRANRPAQTEAPAGGPPQQGPPSPAQTPPVTRVQAASAPTAEPQGAPGEPPDDYDEYSPDDVDLGGSDLVGPPLVAKMLGGTVIDEIVEE